MQEGKSVVVTGGTGFLGRSVVQAFVEAGAHVYVPSIEGNPFDTQDRVHVVDAVDMTQEPSVQQFYQDLPHVDTVVNLAGGFLFAPIEQTDHAAFMRQMDMNIATCFMSCRAAVEKMRASGTRGAIVNVSARAGLSPRLGAMMTAYTVAKAGVAALTEALAEELKADGIRVNAVAPSIINTEVNRMVMPDADHDHWVQPEDLAQVILTLAQESAKGVSGTVMQVYAQA